MNRNLWIALSVALLASSASAQSVGQPAVCAPPASCATGSGGSGDVVGPASAADDAVALFDGTTGKLLKDGGALLAAADVEDQAYTPATDGPGASDNWAPAWADSDPSTLTSALSKIALAVRSLFAAASGKYDVVVDLDNNVNWTGYTFSIGLDGAGAPVATSPTIAYSDNECAQIQAAINPWLTRTDTKRLIKVVGSAAINFADLKDYGPFRNCWGVLPATSIGTDGYPVLSSSVIDLGTAEESLDIEWDDVVVATTMTTQTEPAVIALYGAAYLFGNRATGSSIGGYISQGVTEAGRLTISRTDDIDGSWLAGRIVGSSVSAFKESATSTVLYANDGNLRGNRTNLELRLTGNASDNDDVCFMTSSGWGVSYGKSIIERCGIGVQAYATNVGTFKDWYIQSNDTGIVYGDFRVGGDNPIWESCICTVEACATGSNCDEITGASTNGLRWIGLISESNPYGQLVVIDGGIENSITAGRFETGTFVNRHQILFGAGQCNLDTTAASEVGKTCGATSECVGGTATCTTNAAWRTSQHFVITNTLLPTDNAFAGAASCTGEGTPAACCTAAGVGAGCGDHDGVFIGRGTSQNNMGMIDITNSVIGASTKATGGKVQVGVVLDAATTQREQVRLTSNYVSDQAAYLPSYKGFHSPESVRYEFEVNETGLDGDEGKCVPRVNAGTTTLITCTGAATFAAEYPIIRPPMYYARGGCYAYSATGWDEEVAFYIQEVDTSGAVDSAATMLAKSALRVPNSGTAPTPFTLYTKNGTTGALQAYGALGSATAATFRLVIADDAITTASGDITDTADDAVLQVKCYVDAFPMQTITTQLGYGLP